MPEEMPSDPFREGQFDWGPLAANNFAFFSSHVAAGFAETHALELTSRYLNLVLAALFGQAAQQHPEQQQGEAG